MVALKKAAVLCFAAVVAASPIAQISAGDLLLTQGQKDFLDNSTRSPVCTPETSKQGRAKLPTRATLLIYPPTPSTYLLTSSHREDNYCVIHLKPFHSWAAYCKAPSPLPSSPSLPLSPNKPATDIYLTSLTSCPSQRQRPRDPRRHGVHRLQRARLQGLVLPI